MISIVRPMARSAPMRSDRSNNHTPAPMATRTPSPRVNDSVVCNDTPIPTRWAMSVRKMPAPVAGATHDRTVPGVDRFEHPAPPETGADGQRSP